MTSSRNVKIGLIGTSWWADAMYLPAMRCCPGARITACCGQNEARLRRVAEEYQIQSTHTDWRAMLASEDLDAVIIATPNDTHRQMTLAAFERGLHVLCEKPLGISYDEAASMAAAADEVGVVTMVPFTYSFLPATLRIKELLQQGYIGRPYHLNFRYYAGYGRDGAYNWKFDEEVAGAGALGDIGSHFIYLALWYFGPVSHVTAELGRPIQRTGETPKGERFRRAEDAAVVVLTFQSGAQGIIHATTAAHEPSPWGQTHHLDLHGAGGTIKFVTDWDQLYSLTGAREGENVMTSHHLPDRLWPGDRGAPVQQMYKACFREAGRMAGEFVQAIRSQGSCRPDFNDGLAVQRVMEAALISHREGRRVALTEIVA